MPVARGKVRSFENRKWAKPILIPIAAPQIGAPEIDAVIAVLRSGRLAQGEQVLRLERAFADFIGVRHAVAVSSGTAALHLALLAHNIREGDEVITSPFTFIATVNSILLVGAKPVFADIDPRTFVVDPDAVEASITPRTKAVIPVQLYGGTADMDAIERICTRHGLTLIEDAAQAIGATYRARKVGSFGTGCFSLYATKNLTSGEGGIITTDDDGVAARSRLLRNHGQSERYVYQGIGFNLRMTDIQAAIGLAQFERLQSFVAARRSNATFLARSLPSAVVCPQVPAHVGHVFNQFTIRIPGGRGQLQRHLAERGVGSEVYYPHPVTVWPHVGASGSFPEAERASHEVLSLPVHPGVGHTDLATVTSAVADFFEAR